MGFGDEGEDDRFVDEEKRGSRVFIERIGLMQIDKYCVLVIGFVAGCTSTVVSPESDRPPMEHEDLMVSVEENVELAEPLAPYDRAYDVSELYEAVCADCHGVDGDVRQAGGFWYGAPAQAWTNGPTVDGVLVTLEEGIHASAMRSFPEYNDADRVELGEYVLDLRRGLVEE